MEDRRTGVQCNLLGRCGLDNVGMHNLQSSRVCVLNACDFLLIIVHSVAAMGRPEDIANTLGEITQHQYAVPDARCRPTCVIENTHGGGAPAAELQRRAGLDRLSLVVSVRSFRRQLKILESMNVATSKDLSLIITLKLHEVVNR